MKNKFNLFLLLNISLIVFGDIDITQKGAVSKINKTGEVFYAGVVRLPKFKNSNLELCMCYNGNIIKVSINDNLFMLKDGRKKKINLLLTSSENFTVDSQDNTILYFKLGKGHTYRFFELLTQIKVVNTKRKHTWEITESDLPSKEDKIVVPLDTIIIPIDPEKIELSFLEEFSREGSKVINLPTIVIEGEDICVLEEQINKCGLAFMNIKQFHAKQEKREVKQDNLKVCMVN